MHTDANTFVCLSCVLGVCSVSLPQCVTEQQLGHSQRSCCVMVNITVRVRLLGVLVKAPEHA